MLTKSHIYLIYLIILSLSCSVYAQSAQRAAVASAQSATAQMSLAAKPGNAFPDTVQSALESGNTRKAIKICGKPCKTGTSANRLSAGGKGGTRDYECQNGNCACTSIIDCVEMTDVCTPGTIGCNDYGCTCAEKPPADPDP